MKLTIDFENKTVEAAQDIELGELVKQLKAALGSDYKKYKIIKTVQYSYYPYYPTTYPTVTWNTYDTSTPTVLGTDYTLTHN